MPMFGFYAAWRQLVKIDDTGSVEQVNKQLIRGLQEWRLRQRLRPRPTPVTAAGGA